MPGKPERRAEVIRSKIVGVTFDNPDGTSRQRIIERYCTDGMRLEVCPEPDNPVHRNALGLWVRTRGLFGSKTFQVGYLRAELADELRDRIDRGWRIWAHILEVTGGGRGENLGVNIELRLAPPRVEQATVFVAAEDATQPQPIVVAALGGASVSDNARASPRSGCEFEDEKRGGCLNGCLGKVLFVGFAAVIGAIWFSMRDERRNLPAVNPAPTLPQRNATPAIGSAPSNPRFPLGTVVELIGPKDGMIFLCADEAVFLEFRSHTRKFVPGPELFAVSPSAVAEVLADKGDRLIVKVSEGSWKGRIGWIASDEVRLRPTLKDALRDVVDGLTLNERRTIYSDLYRVAMEAKFESDHQAPVNNLPGSFTRHKAAYDALEKEGRKSLIVKYRRYGIDEADLDRIDKEGTDKRWPLPDVVDPYKP
jgi:hypothetical protein